MDHKWAYFNPILTILSMKNMKKNNMHFLFYFTFLFIYFFFNYIGKKMEKFYTLFLNAPMSWVSSLYIVCHLHYFSKNLASFV